MNRSQFKAWLILSSRTCCNKQIFAKIASYRRHEQFIPYFPLMLTSRYFCLTDIPQSKSIIYTPVIDRDSRVGLNFIIDHIVSEDLKRCCISFVKTSLSMRSGTLYAEDDRFVNNQRILTPI